MSSVSVAEQLEEAVSPVKNLEQNKSVGLSMTPLKRRFSEDENEEVVAKKIRTSDGEQISVPETTTGDAEEEMEKGEDIDAELVVATDEDEKATDDDAKESEQEQPVVDVVLDKEDAGGDDEGKGDGEKEEESTILDVET
ncbi:unnamed protein product [Angiostrongylus costaricensis]|uniref:Nucleolin-like n=1 Tax=Angiostrongylus costaricensis TaxID=334426 RepID=A0A0R3PYX4_ANGCS|nr:unnamed protein product [Angiostrongylus costaricensis]